MKKKVLLVNPDPYTRVLPPLGMSYIAEILQQNGHTPIILDLGLDHSFFEDNNGIDLNEIDYVGITATTLIYFDAKKVSEHIKKQRPDLPVIIGGTHSSVLPDFVLKDSGCDAVIVSEGEMVMLEIVEGKREAKGIIYAPIINDLDSIPFLTYSYLDMNKYFDYKGTDRIRWSLPQPSVAMIATRGCPYSCTFCASKELFGKRVRFRSIENTMKEVDYLIKTYDVKSIYFYDDTLTLKRSWMENLCHELAARKIQWICGTRVDRVDEDLLRLMKKSGCKYISYGIESGSNRMLTEVMKKGITIEKAEEILKLTRKIGIGIIANYMFGLPGETEEDLKLTLAAVKRIPADAAEFSVYIPLPGTELSNNTDWTQYKSGENPYHVDSGVHDTDFSKTVKYYHRKAINSFYFSPLFLLRQTKMILHPKQMFYASKSLFRLIGDVFKS